MCLQFLRVNPEDLVQELEATDSYKPVFHNRRLNKLRHWFIPCVRFVIVLDFTIFDQEAVLGGVPEKEIEVVGR